MAIDGPKIIDSDLAYDTYNEFMDLYDSDFSIEDIKKRIESYESSLVDEIEYEIWLSTYSLALWEIGELPSDIYDNLKQCISKDAGVKMWVDENYETESIKRGKELKRLLNKLSNPTKKVRIRKKYKKITNFIFDEDDVILYKTADGSYQCSIVSKIDQYRGKCSYCFTPFFFSDKTKPSVKDLTYILGTKIGSTFNKRRLKKEQPGIERIWKDFNSKRLFIVGLVMDAILHSNLLRIKNNFELIGKINIKNTFREIGSIGYFDSFQDYLKLNNDLEKRMKIFRIEKIKIDRMKN